MLPIKNSLPASPVVALMQILITPKQMNRLATAKSNEIPARVQGIGPADFERAISQSFPMEPENRTTNPVITGIMMETASFSRVMVSFNSNGMR